MTRSSRDYNRKAIYAIIWALEFNRVSALRKVVNGMFEEERIMSQSEVEEPTYSEDFKAPSKLTGDNLSIFVKAMQNKLEKSDPDIVEALLKEFDEKFCTTIGGGDVTVMRWREREGNQKVR